MFDECTWNSDLLKGRASLRPLVHFLQALSSCGSPLDETNDDRWLSSPLLDNQKGADFMRSSIKRPQILGLTEGRCHAGKHHSHLSYCSTNPSSSKAVRCTVWEKHVPRYLLSTYLVLSVSGSSRSSWQCQNYPARQTLKYSCGVRLVLLNPPVCSTCRDGDC